MRERKFRSHVKRKDLSHLKFAFATKEHHSKIINWTGLPGIKFLRMPARY